MVLDRPGCSPGSSSSSDFHNTSTALTSSHGSSQPTIGVEEPFLLRDVPRSSGNSSISRSSLLSSPPFKDVSRASSSLPRWLQTSAAPISWLSVCCSHSRSPPPLKPPPPPAQRSPPLHLGAVHECDVRRGGGGKLCGGFLSLGCRSCPRGCRCNGTFLSASSSTLKQQQQQKEEEGVRKQTQKKEEEEEPSWWGSTFYSPGRVQECGTGALRLLCFPQAVQPMTLSSIHVCLKQENQVLLSCHGKNPIYSYLDLLNHLKRLTSHERNERGTICMCMLIELCSKST